MKNKKTPPVEILGYRNVRIPTYDLSSKCVVDKSWSVVNDLHGDDDYLPWDEDEGSSIPPF